MMSLKEVFDGDAMHIIHLVYIKFNKPMRQHIASILQFASTKSLPESRAFF